MNTISNEAKNQPLTSGRRGFMLKAGAVALAAVTAVIGGPQEAVAASPSSVTLQECSDDALARLCLMGALMSAWYTAHEDVIQQICPQLDPDLFDLMHESSAAAEAIAQSVGVEVNTEHVAKCAAIYKGRAKAIADASLAPDERVNLGQRQRALLKYYDQLNDVTQLTMIDMAEEFASTSLRRRSVFELAGGAV